LNEGKAQLNTYVSRETRDKINEYIAKYFETPYGALSWLVENALTSFMDGADHPNTQLHKTPRNRSHNACMEIISDLKLQGFTFQFTKDHLFKAINRVRGTDQRTVKKWLRILNEHGYVKFVSTFTLEYGPSGTPTFPEGAEIRVEGK